MEVVLTRVDELARSEATTVTRVALSSKYQIVIPEDVRRELHLEPGQEFDVVALDGRLHVLPARRMSDIVGLYPDIDTSFDRGDRLP
jgi:AbrB family looped-hinge helix DNA binding protein